MEKIDFDIEENQEALRGLYTALESHYEFWNEWLNDRLGIMGDFSVPADERQAAITLGEALLAIAHAEKE